ncbi:rRNA 2'-O-methyltransferase fibrillarin 1-like [Ricinus communis]|uniref:rRNA 2'-O-methyltransferase fibrillarin 1-like n=1 Tax=Ricinus communis TaxID=3988 RepID=UPI00201ADDD9|nr:rRNA 2'-O-methyltransferase fibrillarin 1-like [Ricinus communis]XP_048235241.1 rRNA 2'-O-methyltransferase fibrillarin 1-like [Ricinus communis]XP_048235263.1 rRNA 2'-O-methyltransferase fibrillarin 1-like [Ricinus communis]
MLLSLLSKSFGSECSLFPEIERPFVLSIKSLISPRIPFRANCIDSTKDAKAVYAKEVDKLKADLFKPMEMVELSHFGRDHACAVCGYRMPKEQKTNA